MKIRLLTSISAAHGSFSPGEETDWPDKSDAAANWQPSWSARSVEAVEVNWYTIEPGATIG